MARQLRKVYYEEYIFTPTASQLTTVGPTTFNMFKVPAGYRVLHCDLYITTAFSGGTPTITVGDGDDDDGFIDTGDVTMGSAGIYAGKAANFNAQPGKLYTADDTVDLFYTGHASTTAGAAKVVALLYRIF